MVGTKMKYDYENLADIALKLITQSTTAKSYAIDAMEAVKKGDFKKSDELLDKANEVLLICQKQHASIIQAEASGEKVEISLLMAHAIDQVQSAETIILLVIEIINLYKKTNSKL